MPRSGKDSARSSESTTRSGGGGGYSAPPRVEIGGNLKLSGTLDTPWGPAKIRNLMAEVVVDRIQAVRADDALAAYTESTITYDRGVSM